MWDEKAVMYCYTIHTFWTVRGKDEKRYAVTKLREVPFVLHVSTLVFCIERRANLQADLSKHTVFIFIPEDWDSRFLRGIGTYLQVHMALQTRTPTMT
jgi:hypothetical protein